MTVQTSRGRMHAAFVLMVTGLILGSSLSSVEARPVPKGGKGQQPSPQRFVRQQNTYSAMRFFFTNRGVLFNNDNNAGLFWPRTGNDAYIFGSGVWFATKKIINGRRQKLAEIGYNPNSGAGWFSEGEYFPVNKEVNDGSTFDSKYISYVSPRYDRTSGKYIGGNDPSVPPPTYNWPLWDAPILDSGDQVRTLRQNYYFGDYISNVNERTIDALSKGERIAKPAILSQEDIVNIYSDFDVKQNPEYKPGRGYPFFLNIQEVIYSWSFGRYRDMIFLRHRITNAGEEDLLDCYIAPAFDPDLGEPGAGPAGNDHNAYMSELTIIPEHYTIAQRALDEADPGGKRFGGKLENLNMAYQFSEKEKGQNYGMIGFSFLESPAVSQNGEIQDNSIPGDDGLPRPQLGLTTMKKWTITNDPPTQDLRYDFVSSGARDNDTGPGDVRLLFSTGPFTLKPGKSAETVIGIGIARVSTTQDGPNLDSLIKLMVQAHNVFSRVTVDTLVDVQPDTTIITYRSTINHFDAPEPPKLPHLKAQGLDKAVLVTWDNESELSTDPQAEGLPFVGYELWRSTRSDLDSTIQPTGDNPVVRLGRWSLYDFKRDTVFIKNGGIAGFRYRRINNIPNEMPHSFLDVGDDNKDGTITGSEGLTNGVRYYYYLVAFDEYDSVNNIGPLTTAIVKDINFTSAVPTKPPFVNAPLNLSADMAAQSCLSNGGIDSIRLDVIDQGRFQALYTNDVISVKVQPRWYEVNFRQFPNLGFLWYYFDINDTRQGRALTYDDIYEPGGLVNPYGEFTGLLVHVPGSEGDSIWKKSFTSDNVSFAPNQTIDQTFRLIVDYNMHRVNEAYKLRSITTEGGVDGDLIRLSTRTLVKGGQRPDNLAAIDTSLTRPTFMGSLGENTYDITFGDPVDLNDIEFDTATKSDIVVTEIRDDEGNVFHPRVLPVKITSRSHCDAPLTPIRDGRVNDVEYVTNPAYYTDLIEQAPNFFPANTDPDSMLVPIAGKFAVDAWHFTYGDGSIPADAIRIENPRGTTTGAFYFPHDRGANTVNGKTLATVHRIRVAGAEIILNAPGISSVGETGDGTGARGEAVPDIKPGDKISVSFTGVAKNMPFPGQAFVIKTTKDSVDFKNAQLYVDTVLEQVQVVPNPYVVTHSGQTSTDNAKLYFTRLPPRATIEIYNVAGDLIKTLEHNAYVTGTNGNTELASNATMLEWNLLSEGRQRIGSQVLTARVIAKDEKGGVTGEVIKKFAVVVGGYRIVR
jgi:hypothetical protein